MVNITVMLLKPLCDHTSFMSRDMVILKSPQPLGKKMHYGMKARDHCL